MKTINDELYNELVYLGIIDETNTRNHNIGKSNYSKQLIQAWTIWLAYNLNPWDADIIKRVLRTKEDTPRKEDYEKIIHICQERIRQIDTRNINQSNNIEFENIDYENS